MTAGAYCNRDVIVAEPETSVYDAANMMREFHVGCLLVVEKKNDGDGSGKVIGLVTDRDMVVEVLAQEVDPAKVAISDIMSRDPKTVYEDESLRETMKKMSEHGIRRLPVVYSNGDLAGLLTLDDLMNLLSNELTQLTRLFVTQQNEEQATRP